MTTENVIEKVRKLLALANGNANVNEAAAAAARAEELLHSHKLSMAQVEASGGAADADKVEWTSVDDSAGMRWRHNLLWALAVAFSCKAIRGTIRATRTARKTYRMNIVGKTADTQTVVYMYQYLQNEIDRIVKSSPECRGRGGVYANNFRVGAVEEIERRLVAQRQRRAPVETGTALVLRRDEKAVIAAFEARFPKRRNAPGTKVTMGDAVRAGRAAGASIGLGGGKGLGAAPARLTGAV